MIDTCQVIVITIWLPMAIPTNKWPNLIGAHFPSLSVMSQLININGGHSEGYIRNCIWQTLHPKLLIAHTLHNYNFTFWLFRDNHFKYRLFSS